MDENIMENTEVTEPEEATVPEETAEDCGCTCESSSSFGSGMIGGAVATGLILWVGISGIALVKKIKAKRAAKKAAKNAEESTEALEGDTETE